ncbi:MAG: energy transducer TonB [Acidobacteriota bacterium]|nr:energy transducer TonB [Acidobacteriota bacterium]
MKKVSVLAAVFCLFLAAGAAFAQEKAANFAGTWQLDVAKSKLGERMRVESGTLTVTQTDKNLTVATDFKRAPRPEGDGAMPPSGNGGMRQGGGRGAGMMGGGNGTVTYSLDGKEMTVESETPSDMPSAKTTLKAKIEKDGKLKLNSTRTFNGQMGEMTIKTSETWELLDGGKTLKITRDTESPRGSQTSEMYFTKKERGAIGVSSGNNQTTDGASTNDSGVVYQGDRVKSISDGISVSAESPSSQTAKIISAGVLNGKVLKFVQPEYPPAAKAVKAGGAVSVQVTFDEQGKVISAKAVSGHPLLRAASEQAARKCEFAPVLLQGVPVKVTGIITYNFIF